jgi:protein-L-isoaspartate(D-aspartate) O-methyltransferase
MGGAKLSEHELKKQLVLRLQGAGVIYSQEWVSAFAAVPRHLFVPEGWPDGTGAYISSREDREKWLETVYSDVGIVTQRDGRGYSLSSSSMPSIMGEMLEWLRIRDGQTVVEIGTGSGYNAALLCHRLGAELVTSIDIDGGLVETARERLYSIGYEPHLATVDGAKGYLERAPYDRVIGTCHAWPIPRAWIDQAKPGGRVVAILANHCVGLDVREDGSASGTFHPHQFSFMSMRGGYMAGLPTDDGQMPSETVSRPWCFPPSILKAGGKEQRSFLVLVAPLVTLYGWQPDPSVFGDPRDLSWARFEEGGLVTQAGPRRIWDQIEDLFEQWCKLGCPNRERFGLTVHPDGRHVLWLDEPDSDPSWEISPPTRPVPDKSLSQKSK